ncbi:MAG TPA: lysylphosphatidylglycerol synthase transmembrane domain-containing protein [Candidatus Latescibacteria bacterium]|nr:lysylphosphatidylglycerol synthase transmembrane domain-containing protein [Candidatus Latescibacterota bacterium]
MPRDKRPILTVSAPPMAESSRSRWLKRLRLAFTIIVFAVLVVSVDPVAIAATWRRIDPQWISLAVLLVPPNLFCQYRRISAALMPVYPAISFRTAIHPLLAGLAMGAVTPGRVGELGQVMLLPSGGRTKALGTLTVMRAYGFLSVVALGLAAWMANPALLRTDSRTAVCTGGAVLLVLAALTGVAEWYFRREEHLTTGGLIRRIRGAEGVFAGVKTLSAKDRVRFCGWSLALSFVYLTQLTFLMRAFGAAVPLWDGLLAGAVTTGIVAVLPVAVGNIGVRETAAVVVWKQVGTNAAAAFNGAFLLFLINVVLPGLAGIIWNWWETFRGEGSPSRRP